MKPVRLLLLIVTLPLFAQAAEKACDEKPTKYPLGKAQSSLPFVPGEKFSYELNYEFVKAGIASMEVLEGPEINCRPTFQFVSMAKSTGFIDTFFVVRDYNTSITDKESLMSFAFHQNLREGKFRVERNTSFDYAAGAFKWEKHYKGKTSTREGPLAQPMHDILSAFFTARTLPLELGQEYEIRVFSDADFYQLKIKVAPKLEDVTVPLGTYECIRIDPKILGEGIFKMQDGKLQMWMTADERHIPVLIRSRVALGAFDAQLESFDTPQNDMVKEKVPSR
jgi:hypothetical protein